MKETNSSNVKWWHFWLVISTIVGGTVYAGAWAFDKHLTAPHPDAVDKHVYERDIDRLERKIDKIINFMMKQEVRRHGGG